MVKYGPITKTPKRLPKQDHGLVQLMAERFQRASWAHNRWAEGAKVCYDFLEGRQWGGRELRMMEQQKRPALTFNIIAPLARLMLGYQRNNKTDITFRPGSDARSSEVTAEILTKLEKQLALVNGLEYVDTEVFLDGIVGGRGFFRTLLDFTDNDLGEVKTCAVDPFTVYIDPDADTYDLNESASFTQISRFVSLDEIEFTYGKFVAENLRPFALGQTPIGPVSTIITADEITPIRAFGQKEDGDIAFWDSFYATMGDFVDTRRKAIRIIETEHVVTETRWVFTDLETGDRKVVPEHWDQNRINKALWYANNVANNPLVVEQRQVERIQWTTTCGDMILENTASPYDGFTLTGYFPYFRRGMTRGAIADMLDPQREKNKRRSVEIEMVSKMSNGGWSYHQNSMDPVQKRRLKQFGSTPGVHVEWKGENWMEPKPIAPQTSTMAHERLEAKSEEDIRKISGINESALGELDRVQSGRAIEARQRQAVIAIQMYMDNFKRSKSLVGKQHLSLIQNYYTEERTYRVMGEDSKLSTIVINAQQMDPATGVTKVLNDVTIGKYVAIVDEAPLSATFANAQFEEMMMLLEKMGPVVGQFMPLFADLVIDMSSLPRKEEWVTRLQQAFGMMQQQGAAQAGAGGPGAPGITNAPALDQGLTPAGQVATANPATGMPGPGR